MSSLWLLFVGIVLAVPFGWLISEIRAGNWMRTVLGVLAAAVPTFFVSSLVCYLLHMDYNQSFGYATKDLIKTSLNQIDDGHLDRVIQVWRGLNDQYDPTYEGNRPEYPDLVNEATARMRGRTPMAPNSDWCKPSTSDKPRS
jgi:hypothetical protein